MREVRLDISHILNEYSKFYQRFASVNPRVVSPLEDVASKIKTLLNHPYPARDALEHLDMAGTSYQRIASVSGKISDTVSDSDFHKELLSSLEEYINTILKQIP